MSTRKLPILLTSAAALLAATLACNAGLASPTPALPTQPAGPTPAPADQMTQPPTPETPLPTGEAAACPQPSASQRAYASQQGGYCFLYPAAFEAQAAAESPTLAVRLIGPPADPASQEPPLVIMTVASNGPAVYVPDAQGYADMARELMTPPLDLPTDEATIGGQSAAIVHNIPGRDTMRAAYLVVGGYKYTITVQPQPEDAQPNFPQLAEQAGEVWDTVTGSIIFFEPAFEFNVVKAEDVCPQPGEGTELVKDLNDGYCFLVPAEAERDEIFETGFTLGPVIYTDSTFGDIRAGLVFGTRGPAQGQTPREISGEFLQQLDPAEVDDGTLGGAPALVYINRTGPIPSRDALIVANDWQYTIVNSPYAPEEHPEGMPYVDRLWDTVAGSLAFFTPFR